MSPHRTSAAAALAALLIAGCGSDAAEDRAERTPPSEAERLLYRLKVAWNPRRRDAVVEDLRAATGAHAAVVAICGEPAHALLPEAMIAVRELRLRAAVQHVQGLMVGGPEELRRLAVNVLHTIQPFPNGDLEALLGSKDLEVVLGALDVCRSAELFPEKRIRSLLFHTDTRVRDAAMAAVPRTLPPTLARQVLEMLEVGSSVVDIDTALRLLRRCEVTDAVEKVLTTFLFTDDEFLRAAALRCLVTKRSRLQDPGAVWDLATDPSFSRLESALAFACLERTRSYSADTIAAQIGRLEPERRYRAARCLIVDGRKEGVGHLLELYEDLSTTAEDSGLDEDRRVTVLTAIQQALFRLSGTRAGQGLPEWRAWYERLTEFRPTALPPAPVAE